MIERAVVSARERGWDVQGMGRGGLAAVLIASFTGRTVRELASG